MRNAVCMAVTVRFRAQVTVETAHVIYKTERAFNVNQDGLECIVKLVLLFNISYNAFCKVCIRKLL